MAKEKKRFRVEFSTALGKEESLDVSAIDPEEAEQIVRRRIRVERTHSVTSL